MTRVDELEIKGYHDLTVRVVTPPAGREAERLELELSGPFGKQTWSTSLDWVQWNRLVTWVEWQRRDRDFEEKYKATSKED